MTDIKLVLMDGTKYLIDYKTPEHFNKTCREYEKEVFVKVATFKRDAANNRYDYKFRMISKYAMKELVID